MMKYLLKYPLLFVVWMCIASISPPRRVPLSPDENKILDDLYGAYNTSGEDGILGYVSGFSNTDQTKVCRVVAKAKWDDGPKLRLSTVRQALFLQTLRESGFSDEHFPNQLEVRQLARSFARKKYPWLAPLMR